MRVWRASLGVLGIAAIVAAWHVAVATGAVSPLAMPPPADVSSALGNLLVRSDFHRELTDTLLTWAAAMGITVAIAVPLGLLVGAVGALYPPAAGLVHVLRSIPPTALIPVAIVFFGLGFQMKLAVVSYAVAWPLILNAIYGVRSVDPMMLDSARSLRWSRWRILSRLILPSSARYIGTGVRLAGAIGLVVVLSAELLGASSGIGTLIVRFQQAELPALVYAGIVVVGVIGIGVYYLLTLLERRLSPWAPEHRPST